LGEKIDRELRELSFLGIHKLSEKLKHQYGFEEFPESVQETVTEYSLIRNCLVHNQGVVNVRLAEQYPAHCAGTRLSISDKVVTKATYAFRRYALAVDSIAEKKYLRVCR